MLARRPATAADEPFLRELYRSSRPDLAGWDERERDLFVDLQLRAQRSGWQEQFADSREELITLAGTPIGRLWVAWDDDACVIVDLELAPDRRRGGLGSRILGDICTEADGRGLPVRATVERTNTASLALCARIGLVPVGGDGVHVTVERPVTGARPSSASA